VGAFGILCICSVVASVVGALVWMVAYRIGFSEGRMTVPLRLVHALADHKVGCLQEHPDKVARDLVRLLALPERESRRLVASKLRSASAAATTSSTTHLRSA
jgi:hypothetical protein